MLCSNLHSIINYKHYKWSYRTCWTMMIQWNNFVQWWQKSVVQYSAIMHATYYLKDTHLTYIWLEPSANEAFTWKLNGYLPFHSADKKSIVIKICTHKKNSVKLQIKIYNQNNTKEITIITDRLWAHSFTHLLCSCLI